MFASLRLGLLGVALLVLSTHLHAGELLLGAGGKSPYTIVVAENQSSPAIESSVRQAADLLKKAFAAQGMDVPIVTESQLPANRPGIYLGRTNFSAKQGVQFPPGQIVTYTWKAVGRDIIIAGNDQPDPIPLEKRRPRESKLGGIPVLSTLKATCEFVYQYAGARFLSPRDRDLVFMPTPVLFVPDDLNVTRTVFASNLEIGRSSHIYHVANTTPSLPLALTTYGHYHQAAIPSQTYGPTNPDFFVLRAGKRQTDSQHLCFSNPQVRDLIYQSLLKEFDTGYTLVELGQNDGFLPCDCKACFDLYNIQPTRKPDEGIAYLNDPAWGEKIWIMHRDMALRLQKDRPGAKLLITAYAVTRNPPRTITALPENVTVEIMNPTAEIFAAWKKLQIPGGFAVYPYTWGNFHVAGYTPLRSRTDIQQLVQVLTENNVRLIQQGGRPITFGLEGINIYVLGRMMNDPTAKTIDALYDEYIDAAYQEAASPMRSFYRKLHQRLLFYPDAQRFANEINRNPLLLFSTLYTPDLMTALDSHLTSATQIAKEEGVKARLAAARMEFDFLRHLVNCITTYYAFRLQPSEQTHQQVLDAVQARNDWIKSFTDDKGLIRLDAPSFNTVPASVLKTNGRYMNIEPLNWNLEQRRRMKISAEQAVTPRLTIKRAKGAVTLDSAQWKQASVQTLQPSPKNKNPLLEQTTFQVLYDASNLYVRVEASMKPQDMNFEPRGRDAELWLQECINLQLSPTGDKSQYYYLNYEPVANSFIDAQHGFITDPLHPKFGWNDDTWNGSWTYQNVLDKNANRWVSLVTVPFKTLGATTPAPGSMWMGNVGRVHLFENKAKRELSVWAYELNISNVPGDGYFGEWVFE